MPSVKSGFRVDISRLRRKLASVEKEIRADAFKPEVLEFTQQSLQTASRITPVRSYSTIRANQAKQYRNRINYIPSFHTLENPTLIVKDTGEHFLYRNGKWFNMANRVSNDVWSAYQTLLSERKRRMRTSQAHFIATRAPARFLWRKSWSQVADSLGIPIGVPSQVTSAESRRSPKKEPPRGYGTIQGGKVVLTVVVRNPFLEEKSKYKDFTGDEILSLAMSRHRPQYQRRLESKIKERMKAAFAK